MYSLMFYVLTTYLHVLCLWCAPNQMIFTPLYVIFACCCCIKKVKFSRKRGLEFKSILIIKVHLLMRKGEFRSFWILILEFSSISTILAEAKVKTFNCQVHTYPNFWYARYSSMLILFKKKKQQLCSITRVRNDLSLIKFHLKSLFCYAGLRNELFWSLCLASFIEFSVLIVVI